MSEFNITVEGGTSKRLKTAGKYCDRDIVVTATGGGGAPVTISGVNLHDVTADTPDTYINGDKLTAYKGWTTTDFIPVEKGKLYIAYSTSDIAARYCRMYDENKTGIAALAGTINCTDLQDPLFLNGHDGYFRFSGTAGQITALEFYEVVNFNWQV